MKHRARVLLVGWDSADWKIIRPLLDQGRMPVLAKLLKKGSCGNLRTLEPSLSPMLWTSIATGKHAYAHGVHGFTEVDPVSGRVTPVSAATRRCRTVWEMLADHGLRSNVVGWFATHGERNPLVNTVSNLYAHTPKRTSANPAEWPGAPEGTYWPESLAAKLDPLRLHYSELDGDLLNFFVPRAAEIDQQKDRRIHRLADFLASSISVQTAVTSLMETQPWDFTAVYFRAIDEISHLFMPYHPPRMAGVPEADFELYQGVIASTYQFHDLMLGRLLALAGEETTVLLVSDHGFHSDHLRPTHMQNVPAGITIWHRPQGVFVAAGPGIAAGERVEGARLLDVTPTVLRCFGLPRGMDMEGRVLREVFEDGAAEEEIPTWERPAEEAETRTRPRVDISDRNDLIDHFVELGYMNALPDEPSAAAAAIQMENNWQLAKALMDGGRSEDALPLFEESVAKMPSRADCVQVLATCQLQLGLIDEAAATLRSAAGIFGEALSFDLLHAQVLSHRGDLDGALRHLEAAEKHAAGSIYFWENKARVLRRLRRWSDCEAAAREILARDRERAGAWVLIARCQVNLRRSEEAVNSALEAIALDYTNPVSHITLALGLMQLERWEDAAGALEKAGALAPNYAPSYRLRAHCLRKLGRVKEAESLSERGAGLRFILDFQRSETTARLRKEAAARAQKRAAASSPVSGESGAKSLELVIVSGLPRSGTSLMMQVLAAGGLEPMTDGRRVADESNPEGYLEWEDVKLLPRDPRVIEKAAGKVVKVVSPLLDNLPPRHRYKIIFMRRPITEVVSSQRRMIERSGQPATMDADQLARLQKEHLDIMLAKLGRQTHIELLVIDYPDLVAAPLPALRRVREFLGPAHLPSPDESAMASVIKPALHRQRSIAAAS